MTKYQMAKEMDWSHFRNLPWLNLYDVLSKSELLSFYNQYLTLKAL